MNKICIDNREIGSQFSPYLIAELSANHNGSINTAFALIEMAKRCGADAVKIQTYRPDTITIDCDRPEFKISGGLWDGYSLYSLYEKAHTPWEWHKPLFDYARKTGITMFSSPFDFSAVDFLEDLNVPAYKIASFEAIDLPLIQYAALTGKPMIISTGMANAEEISEAIDAAKSSGCKQLAILHCVSGYPAPAADYNLRTLADMILKYDLVTGLSDHTIDNVTALTSVALGASIIEKHITLDRTAGGPDDSFSLEASELEALCRDAAIAWHALGKVHYGRKASETGNAIFRRSIYFVKSIRAGEVITNEHVRSIRPGFGLHPKELYNVIGKTAVSNIEFGTPVDPSLYS